MLLTVNNLQSSYGDIRAISAISIKVDSGQIVTLVGANAAGKSTTLNCISGVIRNKTGEIEFMGQRVEHFPAHVLVTLGMVHIPEGRRVFAF